MRKLNIRHGIDFEELYDLVRNKISWKKCQSCDSYGFQYYDGKTGEGLSKSPSGIDPEWLEKTDCKDCDGLGFVVYYDN